MRILLLNSGAIPVPPAYGGGVERHTYRLASALARLGAEVDYVTSVGPGASFAEGVTVHPLPTFDFRIQSAYPLVAVGQSIGAAAVTRRARQLLVRHPPDIVSVHTNATGLGTLGFARARSIHSSFTVHNPTPATLQFDSPWRGTLRRLTYRTLDDRLMCATDGLITLNAAMAEELGRRFGPACPPTRAIPLGADLERFDPAQPPDPATLARHRVSPGYVLFVGRLLEHKGVHYLLEAARGTPLPLVLVGDGPERSRLEYQIQANGMTGQARLLTDVPHDDLPTLYRGARLLALPSLAEGLPTVGTEALAAGLPIVASKIPGMEDLVEEGVNGALVPPRDVVALRRALLRYWEEPSLASSAGARSRLRAVQRFSWESVARRTLDFYEQILASGSPEKSLEGPTHLV